MKVRISFFDTVSVEWAPQERAYANGIGLRLHGKNIAAPPTVTGVGLKPSQARAVARLLNDAADKVDVRRWRVRRDRKRAALARKEKRDAAAK